MFYEMAVRHTAELPTVLVCEEGENVPFDLAQMRTIFFTHTDLESADVCRERIEQHLAQALSGPADSPIAASVQLRQLGEGSSQERLLAQLVDAVENMGSELQTLVRRSVGGLYRRARSPQHGEYVLIDPADPVAESVEATLEEFELRAAAHARRTAERLGTNEASVRRFLELNGDDFQAE